MHDKDLSEAESLRLIREMIEVARVDHRQTGFGWLFWGSLLFIASFSSAILWFMKLHGYYSWIWNGMLGVGIVVQLFSKYVRKPDESVKTYIHQFLQKLSAGFFISLFSMIAAGAIMKSTYAFGYYYILYGFWMFVHGSALQFRPLLVGAAINWIAAIAIFLVHANNDESFGWIMVISSIAVASGYLIPGYMLRRVYKKSLATNTASGF
jgi:hypothetical protein